MLFPSKMTVTTLCSDAQNLEIYMQGMEKSSCLGMGTVSNIRRL